MRVLMDACVLYPTVTREIMLGCAGHGCFVPLWSARILEEWARAVARNLPDQQDVARAEIALLRHHWPKSEIATDDQLEASLTLPDINDRHVLAAAVTGHADGLLTYNRRDFPARVLAGFGIRRLDPDMFAMELLAAQPGIVRDTCEAVRQRAEELSGAAQLMRALLKRARLPRLGKALQAEG